MSLPFTPVLLSNKEIYPPPLLISQISAQESRRKKKEYMDSLEKK
jgi:hypothetical protein